VWLDEALIMDYWGPQDYQWHYADGFYLEGLHTLKVEYFERTGNARMRFWWESSGTTPPTGGPPASPVATPAPSAPPAPSTPGPWAAEYFNNRTLSGQPVLTRSDAAVDFDWGWGAPAPQVNQDNFSARWTGTFQFVGGRYTFRTTSDDGVRVMVDGTRVIDGWRLMRGSRTGTVNVGAGTHTVRVEYFEGSGRANVRLTWQLVQASNQGSVVDSGVAQPSPSKAGGAVRLDAWPVSSSCTGGGWMAQIFVEGRGGDGLYTYSWEGQKMAGPTGRSATFEVRSASRGIAIVGEAAVTSGGQTAEVELFVRAPTCP
jgi:hypothetical protein